MSYTGKHEIVGFWGGFHGKTAGVMGLIGDESKHGWGPLPGGRFSVPYADCARCPFKLRYPDCGLACADFARQAIKNDDLRARSPRSSSSRCRAPPATWSRRAEFLPAIQSIAKEIGALLIADEMITGFGRTGRWFGCNHSDVVPDVMTVGKGMGNGFPISGVISSDDIVTAEPFARASARHRATAATRSRRPRRSPRSKRSSTRVSSSTRHRSARTCWIACAPCRRSTRSSATCVASD